MPPSRNGDGPEEAVQDRFGRYNGDRFYNIGINVDGYALAPPAFRSWPRPSLWSW